MPIYRTTIGQLGWQEAMEALTTCSDHFRFNTDQVPTRPTAKTRIGEGDDEVRLKARRLDGGGYELHLSSPRPMRLPDTWKEEV